MAQIQSQYEETRIPFAKMTFSPDVPSTALGPNEYNAGENVETDVRGIRSMAGDEAILTSVPGTPTYVSSGYRQGGEFWFIVATTEGKWWATNGVDVDWYDITPGGGTIVGYAQSTNITEAWNGTVPFFNDSLNPPMFLPDTTGAVLIPYSNTLPVEIVSLTANAGPPATVTAAFAKTLTGAPFAAGEQIIITDTNNYFNGTYVVESCTASSVTYYAIPGASSWTGSGTASPKYSWNYNPNWKSYYAGWMRIYNTPNVGSILVAGNLTVIPLVSGTGDTTSGSPTIAMLTATDALVGGTVTAPGVPAGSVVVSVVVGTSITLDQNATATAALIPLSIELAEPELFPVTVQWSQNFGLNEAPLSWQPTVTNIANQLEVPLRGTCVDAFPSNGQLFLCSYWDTVVFSPINYSTTTAPILGVRLFNQGRGMLTSNAWANTDKLVYGVDSRDIWVFDGNDFQGLGNQRVKNWFFDQLDPDHVQQLFMEVNTQRNQVEIYYTDKNYDPVTNPGGSPNRMISYRYDLDCWNAPRDVSEATFACESPIWTFDDPDWSSNEGSRTVVYARGIGNVAMIQKDQGYSFVTSNANPNGNIESTFRRDNIKLLKDYSGKLMVHRLLPEVVNMGNNELPLYPSTGNISVRVEGSESVGNAPAQTTAVTMAIATDDPWCQIDQNAHRVNAIEITNTSNSDIWMCSASTWQYTQVEDDR
jgi:hypothetical protein